MKRKVLGLTATCQCGLVVGAMDYERTDRKDAGRILGRWIHDGCVITPYFTGSFQVTVNPCACDQEKAAPKPSNSQYCPMCDSFSCRCNGC